MKKIWYFALAFVLLAGCSSTSSPEPTEEEEKDEQTTLQDEKRLSYEVVSLDESIVVDGELEPVWSDVSDVKEFTFPWEDKEAPSTVFRAFVADDTFYFAFEVSDEEILLEDEWVDEKTLDNEDRVELFFAAGDVDKPVNYEIPPYYAIEIDAEGRVHDYVTYYYRDMDNTWNMEGLKTATMREDGLYIVEGSIPLSTFEELGLLQDGVMRVGAFRAEFSKDDQGEIVQEWISWVDPATDVPDFHVDSAFGEFMFNE